MKEITHIRGIFLMLTSIVFFTANTLWVRALALHCSKCDAWQATLFRGFAGMLLVCALYSGSRGLRLKSLFTRPSVIVRGLLGAIGITCYYVTVINLGAARAVVINLTYPIFAALMASVFLNESLGFKKFTWIMIGFLGLLIFLGPQALAHGLTLYDGIAIVGALMAAAVVVLIRNLHQTEHGATIFASQAFYGALLALPIAIPDSLQVPLPSIGSLLLAGIIVAVGQLAMTFAYRHLDVSRGASLQMLLPIATAGGAWYFFGERLELIEILGASLTLIATIMVNRQPSKTPDSVSSLQTIKS